MMNESKQSSQSTIAKKANNKINQSSPPRSAAKANTGDYILKSLIGKRRSSVHARDIISRQLNDSDSSVDSSSTSTINKRKRQRQSDVKKVVRPLRIEDFSDSDVDNSTYQEKLNKTFKRIKKLQPIVKLQRLETEQRLKQQNPFQELSKLSQIGIASNEQKKLDVQLVETRCTPVEIDQNKKLTAKVGKCCRRNNDCQMTELNTRFCILCTAKPADLTYHYIRKHKTESYVSRLTWTQLDDLLVRTNFAELQKSPNNHPARYKVTCIFCELVLIQPFMSLYDHYSKHTGEYAYTCTNCSFIKPFRADILSHQLNSKNCRRANLKIMYRYPPNTMVIHLHYCSICNYVQLNKANVLKHLREQHSTREAVDSNVSKCILTAIQIAADTQACESTSNLTNMESKLNDTKTDDAGLQKTPLCGLNEISDELDEEITVCNEPCPEEIEIDDHIKKLKFFENQVIQNSLSLTETDCPINSNGSIAFAKISSTSMEQHPTQLKCEELDVSDMDVVPLTQFSEKSEPTLNESPLRYRAFPENFTYLGLYKCMADDCYFSTDEADQMLSHLNDHANSECPPVEYLQCAYCVLRLGDCNTAQELVNHIQLKHQHDVYQCSLCSYRSCDASNVSIHQLLRHPYTPNDCFIYMCANQEITCEPTNSYLMMRKAESVQKITCPYCTTKFFATNHLKKHLEIIHKMANIEMDVLKTYSCIYCPTSDRDQKSIRIHLAIHHPGEFPFMCNHNTTEDSKVDSLQSLKLVNLADAVPPHLLKDVSGYKVTDNALEQREIEQLDIKPDIMLLNEETAKVRLRKLTEFTGVSPENLFRCPESACGGFFSLYELWLRHMKARHCALICSCPHCSNTNQYNSDREMLALTDFEAHFETHRGHVYICFHCLDTFKYEDQVRSHAEIAHQLSEIRLERICYNFPYTYKVLIHSTLYTERVMFLSELLKLLEKKLKELEEENLKKLKRQWLVPTTTDWLENFPSHLYCRELTKKCLEEGCKYLSTSDDLLFNHVRNVHKISGHSFLCKQCPFRIVNCHSWEPIFEHLKVHTVSNLYICCVCSFHHRSRNSLMDHIRREHDARDAPFVQIREINKSLFIELAIVFAVGEICFSTIRNCFCCEERSMKVDALALHLKYYHKLRLDYYCQRCFVHLDGLQTCDNHFKEEHLNMKRKIYCTLAYDANIAVTSIQPFQICLHKAAGIVPPIKSEPKDENEEDSVFVLEDDDIAIAKNMHERSLCGADKPVVKCVSTENLLKPPSANPLTNDFVPIRIMNGSTIQIPGEFPNPFINVHQRHNIP
uniref:C2H2-type domain-containing protein n=1 Tax=Glossina brevipalpis TaxID=37001 RepID=A0A1A9WVU8_9MUSC